MDFDVVIALPDTTRRRHVGQILGLRGPMPNLKVGTVTPGRACRPQRQGRPVQFRVDKAGIVHATIGRRRSTTTARRQPALTRRSTSKPASSAASLRKVALSSSMRVGAGVDLASMPAAQAVDTSRRRRPIDA
jgi:large subunit ribosomal protein L1